MTDLLVVVLAVAGLIGASWAAAPVLAYGSARLIWAAGVDIHAIPRAEDQP